MTLETHTEFLTVTTPEGPHQMAWQRWSRSSVVSPPLLVCVHGLTRNRHDFDTIARALTQHYQVITLDILGRGDSDWLLNPTHYGYPLYVSQVQQLLTYLAASTGEDRVDWLGTSMGGLIGMMLASQSDSPIDRLIMNDIGYLVPLDGLRRLQTYVGKAPAFTSLSEVEDYLRVVCGGFGPLNDAQWQQLAEYSAMRDHTGRWVMCYDPAIAQAFDEVEADIDLSAIWNQVRCPTLLLRGAQSDLLSIDTANAMLQRRGTQLVTVEGAGHAPALCSQQEIDAISQFLCS